MRGIATVGKAKGRMIAFTLSICLAAGTLVGMSHAQETPLTSFKVPSTAPLGTTVELPPATAGTTNYHTRYKVEVSGQFIYDTGYPGNIADAECTRMGTVGGVADSTWQKDRWGAALTPSDPFDDMFDLYVNGKAADWKPSNGQADCATENSTYELTVESSQVPPDVDGKRKINLRVWDNNWGNNSDSPGGLTVSLFVGTEPQKGADDKLIETVAVNTRHKDGTKSLTALVAGEQYKFVARGSYSYSYAHDGWLADAECTITGGSDPNVAYDPVWRTSRQWIQGDNRDFQDLLVDSKELSWVPLYDSGGGCNARDHTYKQMFKAINNAPVQFSIQQFFHEFDAGSIYVDIYLVRGATTPPPSAPNVATAGVGETSKNPSLETPLHEVKISAVSSVAKEIDLGSLQADGTLRYYANYRIEVSGTYIWEYSDMNNLADAECSRWVRANGIAIPDPTWQQNRFGATKLAEEVRDKRSANNVKEDPLDLYLNGGAVDWAPLKSNGAGCNTTNNTYELGIGLPATKKVSFVAYEPLYNNAKVADTQNVSDADPSNNYSLTVKIFPAPEPRYDPMRHVLLETVRVDTLKSEGAWTTSALIAGQQYRFVVSNMYVYNYYAPTKSLADAECSIRDAYADPADPTRTVPADLTWRSARSWDGVSAGDDLLDLYVDKAPQKWEPLYDTGGGCNTTPDHSYRLNFTARQSGAVNFAIKHKYHGFDAGYLYVDVFMVKPESVPSAPTDVQLIGGAAPGKSASTETPLEIVKIPAGKREGVLSQRTWLKGQNLRLEVSGAYLWDYRYSANNQADAECTRFALNPRALTSGTGPDVTVLTDNSWRGKRFPTGKPEQPNPDSDGFDLYVDGGQMEWKPLTPDSGSPECNSKDNTYEVTYTPLADRVAGVTGLNFRVSDPFFDNQFAAGELIVKIFPGPAPRKEADDLLIETVSVDSSNAAGAWSLSQLAAGQKYKIVADGTYKYDYRRPGSQADPECTIVEKRTGDSATYPATDAVWKAGRIWDGNPASTEDQFDLLVSGSQVEWLPLLDTGNGCNSSDHSYRYIHSPKTTGALNLKVKHPYHPLATGTLRVEIYLIRSKVSGPQLPAETVGATGSLPGGGAASTGTPLATVEVSAVGGKVSSIELPRYTNIFGQLKYHNYYRFEVGGTYIYNKDIAGNVADAECSAFSPAAGTTGIKVSDPSWQSNRFPTGDPNKNLADPKTVSVGSDPLDLYVDGQPSEWAPVVPDATSPTCNSKDHTYEMTFKNPGGTEATKSVQFAIYDPFTAGTKTADTNISYSLTVKIFPGAEPPAISSDVLVQVVKVEANNPSPVTTVPLLDGQRYRFVVDGIYNWDTRTGGNSSDAECSMTSADPSYKAKRSWGGGDSLVAEGVELLDLLVNENPVDWVPLYDPTGSGCNVKDHTYRHYLTARGGQGATLRIKHPYTPVAGGSLTVKIYLSR